MCNNSYVLPAIAEMEMLDIEAYMRTKIYIFPLQSGIKFILCICIQTSASEIPMLSGSIPTVLSRGGGICSLDPEVRFISVGNSFVMPADIELFDAVLLCRAAVYSAKY